MMMLNQKQLYNLPTGTMIMCNNHCFRETVEAMVINEPDFHGYIGVKDFNAWGWASAELSRVLDDLGFPGYKLFWAIEIHDTGVLLSMSKDYVFMGLINDTMTADQAVELLQ